MCLHNSPTLNQNIKPTKSTRSGAASYLPLPGTHSGRRRAGLLIERRPLQIHESPNHLTTLDQTGARASLRSTNHVDRTCVEPPDPPNARGPCKSPYRLAPARQRNGSTCRETKPFPYRNKKAGAEVRRNADKCLRARAVPPHHAPVRAPPDKRCWQPTRQRGNIEPYTPVTRLTKLHRPSNTLWGGSGVRGLGTGEGTDLINRPGFSFETTTSLLARDVIVYRTTLLPSPLRRLQQRHLIASKQTTRCGQVPGLSSLLDDGRHDSCANRPSALAEGEAKTLVHHDWADQLRVG